MKIISLLGEAGVGNKANLSVDQDLLYKAKQKYPQYSGEQALTLYIADEMTEKDKVDSNQNKLIDTQKRENDRLRGAVQSLGQELQDFEQQSQETDREVERLKQLSGKLSQDGSNTQVKAKVSGDDLEKLEKKLEALKIKPGIDIEKVKKLEAEIKKIASNPSFNNNDLSRVQNLVDTVNNKQVVSDNVYKKAFIQLQTTQQEVIAKEKRTQQELDSKEERFKRYIAKKGSEAKTSAEEIKKYSDIVQGYKSKIDNFGNELKNIEKEKDITLKLRAGAMDDAQKVSDMKDQIEKQFNLINSMTSKITNQGASSALSPEPASNDPVVEPIGNGPNAAVLRSMNKPGLEATKNISLGAQKMMNRKLTKEGVDSKKPIKPLQKYKNPKYNEWISNHLPALIQIFKNKYWEELDRPEHQYTDSQIHYIIEKYTPMLYNLGDEKTPLTSEQVDNWLEVVKDKLWEQRVENQLELFTESLDKTYARMLDKIIGLPYI